MAEPHHPCTTTPPHKGSTPQEGSFPAFPTQHKPYQPITDLLSRAFFFLIFVTLLPLFPAQGPEFANQPLLTRSLELLHLLLVGIAVSYGLFGHRNADPTVEKEAQHRADHTPQSYLAQLLQVSPVFDDEDPATTPNKLQVWSSRYQRAEPAVVVAPARPGDGGSVGRRLLLPVRSLRSRIPEDRKVGEAGTLFPPAQGEELAGDRVDVPSPIPWRSRSGRMEAMEEAPATAAPSPRRISPSPSASPEPRTKPRKKTLSEPPPTPQPPPRLPFIHKPPNSPPPDEKDEARRSRSFREELNSSTGGHLGRRGDNRGWNGELGSPRFARRLHTRSRSYAEGRHAVVGRSVRTVRPREVLQDAMTSEKKKGEEGEAAKGSGCSGAGVEEENEVDKKAGEFIAKFREQIRLQRIDSIKQTAGPRRHRKS